MTAIEAKNNICEEFINRYYEWLNDISNLTYEDYIKKYGFFKPENKITDNINSVILFQKYIFCGRYINGWEKQGYDRYIIWQLHNDKFLSYDYDSSWRAKQLGKSDFYYISQATAKQIYKNK